MLPILFAIGGGIKAFFAFLFRNWKVTLVIIALLAAAYGVLKYGQAQYTAGSDAALAEIRKQISLQNTDNRKTEKNVDTSVKDFSTKKQKETIDRHIKEEPYINDIKKRSPDNSTTVPQTCDIPGQVVLDINSIRALGPKGN